jgi:hypothetical protein
MMAGCSCMSNSLKWALSAADTPTAEAIIVVDHGQNFWLPQRYAARYNPAAPDDDTRFDVCTLSLVSIYDSKMTVNWNTDTNQQLACCYLYVFVLFLPKSICKVQWFGMFVVATAWVVCCRPYLFDNFGMTRQHTVIHR